MLLAACAREADIGPMFDTVEARRADIEVGVSSAGVVEPLTTVEVKSKASGEVLELRVETGDYVEEDTLMVRIDPRIVRRSPLGISARTGHFPEGVPRRRSLQLP